jgi:hypothetical protein
VIYSETELAWHRHALTAWHSAGDNRDAQPGKLCGTVAPVSMTQPGDNKLRGQQIADQIGGNVPP